MKSAASRRLTDNGKTVTVEHVAGNPVRHPEMVAVTRAANYPGAA